MNGGDHRGSGRTGGRLVVALLLVGAGALGGWFAQRGLAGPGPAGTGLAARDRAAVETVVHDYILAHPEVLPEAMERLRAKEDQAQVASARGELETPFPGAVLGNPQGKTTLVEFSDFACGYCRQSIADVEALIAERPDLRVVMRELPILSPESTEAARWALAAAEQGRYAAFRKALFASGRLSSATIAAAAQGAGLDMARAKAALADPRIDAELKRNVEVAHKLGFQGTPTWVAGGDVLSGAVGKAELAKAIGAPS
jgi:protein-disulfide isomerase